MRPAVLILRKASACLDKKEEEKLVPSNEGGKKKRLLEFRLHDMPSKKIFLPDTLKIAKYSYL